MIYLLPYFGLFLFAFLPAILGVIACDKMVNKSEEWKHFLWVEAAIFAFAVSFSFVTNPIELSMWGVIAIPTSFTGTLIIGYGTWLQQNEEAEYCGKDKLYFYSMFSIFAGFVFFILRLLCV